MYLALTPVGLGGPLGAGGVSGGLKLVSPEAGVAGAGVSGVNGVRPVVGESEDVSGVVAGGLEQAARIRLAETRPRVRRWAEVEAKSLFISGLAFLSLVIRALPGRKVFIPFILTYLTWPAVWMRITRKKKD